MKELLALLAMKNGRMKTKTKTKMNISINDKKDVIDLIARVALEAKKEHIHMKRDPSVGANEEENVKFENATPNATSTEELENILLKLKLMGAKGKRVLKLLKKQALSKEENEVESTTISQVSSSIPTSPPLKVETESREDNLLRQKREFILKTALKSKELNDVDEESENLAIEEVYPELLIDLQ